MDEKKIKVVKTLDLVSIIEMILKIPGAKVSREEFLREQFKNCTPEVLEVILQQGPVNAGFSQEELRKKAMQIVVQSTAIASGGSFLAGIPGGIAIAAALPADIIQFYANAIIMAQKLLYLYGESDFWCHGVQDPKPVIEQLVIYFGVMFGAGGAAELVRVMAARLAKKALKKLPAMALTKKFYYIVVRAVLKFFGIHLTKGTFAKGVYRVVPVLGGFISGGITMGSMYPMGMRLINVLDEAHYHYTQDEYEQDMQTLTELYENERIENPQLIMKDKYYVEDESEVIKAENEKIFKQIENARKMLDNGIISEAGFAEIERKLIEKIQ